MNRRAFFNRLAPAPDGPTLPFPTVMAAPAIPAAPLTGAPLAITAGLEPYTAPLDRERAAHLLRRVGFGAAPVAVEDLLGRDPAEAVDSLVDAAVARLLPETPPWADAAPPRRDEDPIAFEQYVLDNDAWLQSYRTDWVAEMYAGGLRERLTLFWHNHFVTATQSYFIAPFAYRYLTALRTHALGNFKDFVREIGLNPAMLLYLNGNTNFRDAPNENYARELMELFTMGREDAEGNENYTEDDIREVARALTGWIVDFYTLKAYFIGFFHDEGTKTFLGRTGTFGYDDVVDILFEERGPAIATHVCRKLYQEFVYAVPDEALVAELAGLLLANDFELAPVVRVLLKSAHFFDAEGIGARIKSPVELSVGLFIERAEAPDERLNAFGFRASAFTGQFLLDPPNVAGWPGYHAWLSTTTLPIRWIISEAILYGVEGGTFSDLVPLAAMLHDPEDEHAGLYLPAALADHFLPVDPASLDLGTVADDFTGDLVTFPIPDDFLNGPPHRVNLAKLFLGGTPWYEWSINNDNAGARLLNFTRFLLQFPEYQLI